MSYFEQFPVREVILENITSPASGTPTIVAGNKTTRATVLAEVPSTFAIGSAYYSTAGKIYLKVAAAGAATDWERVTTSAAD